MKTCTKCQSEKPAEDFRKQINRKDGLHSWCKSCSAEASTAYRKESPEAVKASKKTWCKKNPVRNRATRRDAMKRYRAANLTKDRARRCLRSSVRRGTTVKPECCTRCAIAFEKRELQGHHSDYSKPLEVTWLCGPCHNYIHGQSVPQAVQA